MLWEKHFTLFVCAFLKRSLEQSLKHIGAHSPIGKLLQKYHGKKDHLWAPGQPVDYLYFVAPLIVYDHNSGCLLSLKFNNALWNVPNVDVSS